jgi:hypothetical protein
MQIFRFTDGTTMSVNSNVIFSYLMSVNRFTRPSSIPMGLGHFFDRYDNETFSPETLKDLAIKGCAISKDALS